MSQILPRISRPRLVPFKTEGQLLFEWWIILTGVPLLFELLVLWATGKTERFFELCFQALPGFLVVWPVSIPLLLWLYFGWSSCLERDEMCSLHLLWLVPFFVLPLTMLVWGALFYNPDFYSGNYDQSNLTFLHFTYHAMFLNAILAIGFNYGRNSFVIPFCLLALLLNFFCAFIAGSAVSGEWL